MAKPAKFIPPMSLAPGELKKIAITAKIRLTKINQIREKLDIIEAQQYSKKAKMSKKLAAFHAELDAEYKAQLALFKQASAEVSDKAAKTDIAPLLKTIEKECSEALAAFRSTNNVLYRGVSARDAKASVYVGRSRNDRRTLTSTALGQVIYDAALRSMGITALRSNSTFTTSDLDQASGYGDAIYLIIPKNGFQFSWSTKDPDIVIDDASKLLKKSAMAKVDTSVTKFLKSKTLVDDFSDRMMHHGYEDAVEYLRKIKYPEGNIAKIKLEDFIDFKYIQNNMGPTNKNFNLALENAGEVLISGEYYAFNIEKYAVLLKTLLKINIIQ